MATQTPTTRPSTFQWGALLCRVVIPLWVLTGAVFKLIERDPKLLPKPIIDLVVGIGSAMGLDDRGLGVFLEQSLRFLIGTELLLVALMFFVPRLARPVAIFTLSVFVLVLLVLLGGEVSRTGISALWKGSCGCFGKAGPPPIAVLAIDSLLLAGAVVLPNRAAGRGVSGGLVTAIGMGVAGILGFAIAFAVPAKGMVAPPTDNGKAPDVVQGSQGGAPVRGWAEPPALKTL